MAGKCVLCYSGGLDSTVLLYWLLDQDYEVRCLSVDYGQRHGKELSSAFHICHNEPRVKQWKLIPLLSLRTILKGSSQTDPSVSVPEGHYADETMKLTVVPNRNMILLSLATAWAISTKSDYIAYAAHAGDHAIYPDCRKEFLEKMAETIGLCDWNPPKVLGPFLQWSKADIVSAGAKLGVPFDKTWSCYNGREKHCGKCGTCVERKEAFELAGVTDPTEYE